MPYWTRIPADVVRHTLKRQQRSMLDQIKEYDHDKRLARKNSSAVSEHSGATGHYLLWEELKFIDRDQYCTHGRLRRVFT